MCNARVFCVSKYTHDISHNTYYSSETNWSYTIAYILPYNWVLFFFARLGFSTMNEAWIIAIKSVKSKDVTKV